jgi:site-specific DNA recombinase
MLVQLLGVFAEFERATIIDRVVNGMERKAARGGWPGGPLPYGLALDEDKRLAVQQPQFSLIERVFHRYAEGGVGAIAIATELNEDGHRTRNGRLWSAKAVLDILRNRTYLGEVYFRGTWHPSAEEPFIDRAVFDKVQAILGERGEGYAQRFTTRRPPYLLTGLIRCGRCQRNFVGVSGTGKRHRYRYYRCWTRHRYGVGACSAEPLRADEMEDAVMRGLLDVYAKPHAVREALAGNAAHGVEAAKRAEQEAAAIDAELRRVEGAIERYMHAFESGRLSEDMFAARIDELAKQAAGLRARRAEAADAVGQSSQAARVPTVAELKTLRGKLSSLIESAPDDVRKLVAQAFVHELVVEHRQRILSTFRALGELPDPRNGAGTDAGPGTGGVRTMTPQVEVAGIEPASFGLSTGLLRAQPVEGSRASHRHRHRCEAPVN